jgi:hypothetical protein
MSDKPKEPVDQFPLRLNDLIEAARRMEYGLINGKEIRTSELGATLQPAWEKFTGAGLIVNDAPNTAISEIKKDDVDINKREDIDKLFDRTSQDKAYVTAINSKVPAWDSMKAKLKSDYLASMRQAMAARYSNRIRHTMAAASRRASLREDDFNTVSLIFNKT